MSKKEEKNSWQGGEEAQNKSAQNVLHSIPPIELHFGNLKYGILFKTLFE